MRIGPFIIARAAAQNQFPDPAAVEWPETVYRRDECECGGQHFSLGGPVAVHESNGEHARIRTESAVLSCLRCGERWYGTPTGLKKPHEAALPPAWAMQDLQARARREQDAAREAHAERQREAVKRPRPEPASAGFRRPPRPEPS